jgi:universal stress protein A
MLEFLEETWDKVLALRVSGELTHEDTHKFFLAIDAKLARYRGARALIELDHPTGLELRTLADELAFDREYGKHLERCAIVGDRAWERWMVKIAKPFYPHTELRFFETDQREEAKAWIHEGLE